jgi:hypothetical protein
LEIIHICFILQRSLEYSEPPASEEIKGDEEQSNTDSEITDAKAERESNVEKVDT